MSRTGFGSLAALAVLVACSWCRAEDRGGVAPEFIWRDVGNVTWSFYGNAKIVGDELVCIADETNRNAFAVGRVDLKEYDGSPLQMQIVASSENVTRSSKSYLGFRFMLSYLDLDMGGGRVWPNGGTLNGTKAPTEIAWRDINSKHRGECEIQLGLHDCTGKAVYNLKTLQARATSPLVPKVNAGYKVKYPERVKRWPLLRGTMLGYTKGDAWDVLKGLGATLCRHQISLGGTGPATNHEVYIKGYLANFDKRLDELEWNLQEAGKRGIKIAIDQHSTPGGVCDAGDRAEWRGDCRIFHDPVYAQLFIDCWVKLVKRMAPYRAHIYGYDLMNEAHHNAPALPDGDIVNLQRRAAEAIRAVDPDTPIILESMYCDPAWFARMSAIKMDNVIYQVHLYYPHDYTHQAILTAPDRVEYWPDPKKGWNRDFLKRSLKPVIDFQKEHGCRMFVGEFSVIAWAPNAEQYLRDCISLFEELGWDWTYHAFREFQGWSTECVALSRGMPSSNFAASTDNPRHRVLAEGLKGGFAPGKYTPHAVTKPIRKVCILGNSITRHGPAPKIGWTNDWGMAASAPDKDYVHLLLKGIEARTGVKPEYRQVFFPLERDWPRMTNVVADCAAALAEKPDLLVLAVGENDRSLTNDVAEVVCQRVYENVIREFQKIGTKVVVRGTFWPSARWDRVHEKACRATGAVFVKTGHLGHRKEQEAHDCGFWHGGVAMHPGDVGMVNIADLLLRGIFGDEPAK